MSRKDPRDPDLIRDLDLLLDMLRDEWDFGTRRGAGVRGADLVQGQKPLTSKRFTDAVLDAETELHGTRASWERRIKRRFVQRYGHSVTRREYRL
ncbi:MAG: hypothetical protein WBG08_14050 [Litorimonas sp.]